MDAVQAMTGSGGWPLNVFLHLLPNRFMVGHISSKRAFNRPSWQEVLLRLLKLFQRNEIDSQAENLTEHLLS
jgi:uncharacterized protein YyaL (SSP411 family)